MAGAATVEKALDVLFHLHEAPGAMGLSEIGRALELPKSSCHRLLSTLVDREVVERDEVGRYRPGLALLALGLGAQEREPVVQAARPTLEAEAVTMGETVFLVGRRRDRLRVLDRFEGTGFLRAAPGVGEVIPSDVTAAGKLYQVFGAEAPAFEANPETDDIQRQGYALNRDAWIEGLSVLGVPVWQRDGAGHQRMIAALALAASSPRFDAIGEEQIAGRLLAASVEIGTRLGLADTGGGSQARSAARRARSLGGAS